jgi:hypothetical protein
MEDGEIELILGTNPVTAPYFRGVYAADTFPSHIEKKPCCFVINNDPIRKPGQHWTAVFFDANGKTEFFCSFGRRDFTFMRKIERNSDLICFSPLQIQSNITAICGLYCCIFLYYKCLGVDLHELLCDCYRLWNDEYVMKVFGKVFKEELTKYLDQNGMCVGR